MLFPCGWPRAFSAFIPKHGIDEIVSISSSKTGTLVASRRGLQLWSASQNPFKIAQKMLSLENLQSFGPHITAEIMPETKSIAALTSRGWLCLYILEPAMKTKHIKLPSGFIAKSQSLEKGYTMIPFMYVNIYGDDVVGTCLTTDDSVLIVGTSSGTLQSYDWEEMLRTNEMPQKDEHRKVYIPDDANQPSWFLGSIDPLGLDTAAIEFGSGDSPIYSEMKGSVIDLNYSRRVQSLTITFQDGSVGLCRTGDWGIGNLEDLQFKQWICEGSPSQGLKATCARVGDCANMVAVGCTDGSVVLFRISSNTGVNSIFKNEEIESYSTPVPSPVRKLNLVDWGHGPEITGPVSDIKWNQDCTAFAVGFKNRGIVVWTPSGCRLMCSLPHTPLRLSMNYHHQPQKRNTINAKNDLLKFSSNHIDSTRSIDSIDSLNVFSDETPALEWGVSVIAWCVDGYRLWVGKSNSAQEIWEIKFVKSLIGRHRVSHPNKNADDDEDGNLEEVHILLGDDRLILISETNFLEIRSGGCRHLVDPYLNPTKDGASESDLLVRHILAPQDYILDNWPLRLIAVSNDSGDIAVAGEKGLALFSRRNEKWKLFGDISQERAIRVYLMSWLSKIIIVCSETIKLNSDKEQTSVYELMLFPRFHLDFGSMLCSKYALEERPVALDCLDKYIMIASEPLNVTILEAKITGDLLPYTSASVSLEPIRELSIISLERPITTVALVTSPFDSCIEMIPQKCVILRWGGIMSMLDMDKGIEQFLTSDVECFWLSDAARLGNKLDDYHASSSSPISTTEIEQIPAACLETPSETELVEMPWWAYGVRGMELWFPSSLNKPLTPRKSNNLEETGGLSELDPELEFDREVYPIGISLADAAIVGVTQRMNRPQKNCGSTITSSTRSLPDSPSAKLNLSCFNPIPESQPVLPCLLRRLLQRGAIRQAKLLAQRHQQISVHFSKSLEWLLFTALEIDIAESNCNNQKNYKGKRFAFTFNNEEEDEEEEMEKKSLLTLVAALVKSFPQHPEAIVSVARKTDAQMWPRLFEAVGKPSELHERLLSQGSLHSAACLLIVTEKMEGLSLARTLALQVLQAAIRNTEYALLAELLRYVIGPPDFEEIFGSDLPEIPSDTTPTPHKTETPTYSTWLFSWIWDMASNQEDEDNDENQIKKIKEISPLDRNVKEISATSWEAAHMVRDHVIQLLDYGQLRFLAQLCRSCTNLGGGIPTLMSTVPEKTRDILESEDLSVRSLISMVLIVKSEFGNVLNNTIDAAADIELLLETVQHARRIAWSLALALALSHMPVLVGFQVKYPQVWQDFCDELSEHEQLLEFANVVKAVQGN